MFTILTGKESVPGANIFSIFATTIDRVLKSQGTTINLDFAARHAHLARLHWTGRGIVRG